MGDFQRIDIAGLDDDVVEAGPGTAIRVGQVVMRTWRCLPTSQGNLRWLCIRGDGGDLPHLPDDAKRDDANRDDAQHMPC